VRAMPPGIVTLLDLPAIAGRIATRVTT
jgi:hypothetical protein